MHTGCIFCFVLKPQFFYKTAVLCRMPVEEMQERGGVEELCCIVCESVPRVTKVPGGVSVLLSFSRLMSRNGMTELKKT